MENSFQTSFIPKKPIVENGSFSVPKSKTTSISMIVTVLLLVVMLVSAGGLFLYKGLLAKNMDNLSSSLLKVKDSFDEKTISELELYDKRSSVSNTILNNHIVLSPLFNLINELTLSSIQYTKFSHSTNAGVFSVKMSGIASDYKSIASQADVFNMSQGKMFKDVVFSNLTKDKNNNVTFDVEFIVDPALLSYSNMINNTADTNTSGTTPANTQDATSTVSASNNTAQTTGDVALPASNQITTPGQPLQNTTNNTQ